MHHSSRIALENIPAPSCGIASTSTLRELHTITEKSPRCAGEKADMASVTSPSVTLRQCPDRTRIAPTYGEDQHKGGQSHTYRHPMSL